MQNKSIVILGLEILLASFHSNAQLAADNAPTSAGAEITMLDEQPYATTDQGAYFRNWSRTVTKLNNGTGDVTTETNSYVEVASGLNYQDAQGTGRRRSNNLPPRRTAVSPPCPGRIKCSWAGT